MKKVFMFIITGFVFSCTMNYKLNHNCEVSSSLQLDNAGKASICLRCDSLTMININEKLKK